MTRRTRKVLIGLAGAVGAAGVFYGGMLVYLMYFWKPQPIRIPKEVTDLIASETIAWVSTAAEPIQVWNGKRRETPSDRHALSRWLCDKTIPGRRAVLFGQTAQARGLLEMEVVELPSSPMAVPCRSDARFYALRDRPRRQPHE